MTQQQVEIWLKTGDAAMLRAMEIITEHGNPQIAGTWAKTFMADVPVKSRKFHNKMTSAQRDSARGILAKKEIMAQLQTLLPDHIDGEVAAAPDEVEIIRPDPRGDRGDGWKPKAGVREIAKEPDRDYAMDPSWGAF